MSTSSQYGAFVPSNWIWDIQQLQQIEDISPELKELLVRLYQNLNLMANVLNVKETGQYPLMETVNGQLWFPNPANNSSTVAVASERQVLRTTLLFLGALPNSGSQPIAHDITVTPATTFTRIYATANAPGSSAIALPDEFTTVIVGTSNVVISTTANLSAYTITYVVLEYIQS